MGFLAKIRNSIKRYKSRDFRTSIERDRAQKYLFSEGKIRGKRGSWTKVFKKSWSSSKRLSPFSRFIQEKIHIFSNFHSRQNLYLGYIGWFLILACLYIIFYSPYFHISPSKVIIESTNEGIDLSIAYRTIEDIYGKSVFFIDEESLARSLKNDQKNIKEISIDRLYPNGIKIILSSYPILYTTRIASIENKTWWTTENGVLIPENANGQSVWKYKLFIHSDDITEDTLLDYKPLMSESRIRMIEKSLGFIEQTWWNLQIGETDYFEKENEFHIKLSNKTRILLSFEDFSLGEEKEWGYKTLSKELLSLKTFIDNHQGELTGGKYIYIDARIAGKIFSCKEVEICKTNLKIIYGNTIEK